MTTNQIPGSTARTASEEAGAAATTIPAMRLTTPKMIHQARPSRTPPEIPPISAADLESPWQKEHGEPEAPRDWLRSPLAAIESKASELEKRWIGEVPWAKVGASVGYAVGFAVIQVILLVFTEGIGNAIEQAAVGLGRLAGNLGKLGRAIGAAAEFVAEIGRGIGVVESLIGKVVGAALKPLENLLKPVLEPLTEMLGGLRTLLRKLLGVAEKEAPALEQAAAKALGEAEKHVPVPHAPAAHPPAVHPPEGPTAPGHAPATAGEHAPQAKPPAPHGEPLAKEPVSGGHTVEVTDHGIELCSPKPCPLLRVQYADELARDPVLREEADAIDKLRKAGKSPEEVAKRAAALRENLEWRKAHFGKQEPLVAARVQGPNKGQYWEEGTPEFERFAGSKRGRPDPRHVVLPKSQAESHFRPAHTPHDPSITPYRTPGGTQMESSGAGRRTPHDITARTARKPAPPGSLPGQDLESKVADPAAQRGFRNVTQADLSQAAGNKALIDRGERVLLRPGNVSTGGVDSITVSFDKAGNAKIYLNDFTTAGTAKEPKLAHANWRKELNEVIAPGRLSLGDGKLDRAVRAAVKKGNVYVRTVRVEIPAQGAAPKITFDTD